MNIDYNKLIIRLANDVNLDSLTINYCLRRIKSEGIQFLTVTLPMLSKAVIHSLEVGHFVRPTSIAWKGRSLRYFRSLLNNIFCSKTGNVLDKVDPESIRNLRQFCEYFYKLALDFDPADIEDAIASFLNVEEEVSMVKNDLTVADQLRKDVSTYYSCFSKASVSDVFSQYRPRCGPGTWSGMEKDLPYYIARVSKSFTSGFTGDYKAYSGYFKSYPAQSSRPELVSNTSDCSELLFVPKDSRGPRTIVREPYHTLKPQLAFFDWITSNLEKISNKRINFRSQAINRELARRASMTKSHATLDLKEASDRVSRAVCSTVFRDCPAIRFFINTRSTHVKLPNGKVHRLQKLSGMGSGLTFPIMSFLAHLAISRRIVNRTGHKYNYVARRIFTYGDDIIVPSGWYTEACQALDAIGLKVNIQKSFIHSRFRESCGGDYWDGTFVGPVRFKAQNSKPSVSGRFINLTGQLALLQVERHCRELVKAGLCNTASYLYDVLEHHLGMKLPVGTGETPYFVRYTVNSVVYPTDSTSKYIKVRTIMFCPKRVKIKNMDEDFFISNLLRPRSEITSLDWWNDNIPNESTYNEVSKPRSGSYRHVNVSGFSLMG